MSTPANFVEFACALADAARAATLPVAAGALAVEDKGAGGRFDPVTAADRDAERAMRAMIEAAFPEHGISGEEFGAKPSAGRHCWSLDPIDGTRAFICGLPSWTTLIALLEDGAPVLGLIDAPAIGERYLAADGDGRLLAGGAARPLAASGCRTLAEARLATTDPFLFEGAERAAFDRLRQSVRTARYGYDAYAYARLAAGGLDLVAESGLQPHDIHALVPVVRAAGGHIGNWRGGTDLGQGDVVAAATPALYEQAVRMLALS